MSPALVSLSVMALVVAVGARVGFLAAHRRPMDLEQWLVGARGFGALVVFLLMAGEIFTTFTFLGISGWTYSLGGPALYALAYNTLGAVVGFFLAPRIWAAGKQSGMLTQSDFFAQRYGSRWLAAVVCVVGIASLVPYLQLQVVGLGIIASMTSLGAVSRSAAMSVAVVLLVGFVFLNGVRAVAAVSILKDALMLLCAVVIGIGVPLAYFGSIGAMFTALIHAHPHHLTLPGDSRNLGHAWYVSTVLMSALGMLMWPHLFGATFTARSADALRRNYIVMPLYILVILLMFFAGYTALLVLPHLKDGDLALLAVVRQTFPPWFLGLVGGAGALAAIVPAAILILTASSLFAKNLFRAVVAPGMSDAQVRNLARAMVLAMGAGSLYLAIREPSSLVSLLLLGYAGVVQFFPGVLLGLYWPRARASAVFFGMIAGIGLASFLMLTHRDPYHGWNAGFLGLCANFLLTVLLSASGRSIAARPAEAIAP